MTSASFHASTRIEAIGEIELKDGRGSAGNPLHLAGVGSFVSLNFLERLVRLVRRSTATDSRTEDDHGTDGADGAAAQLFYCASCDVTLISREMLSCPRCGESVEEVPNERKLDRFRVD